MDLMNLFQNFAFPVAACIAEAYIILKIYQGSREDLKAKDDQIRKMTEEHSKESSDFTAALNRNTVVLERLCTMLGDKEGTA